MIKDNKYLHNGFFYLTCNNCDTLINNMSEADYTDNGGYCTECNKENKGD